MLRTAALFTLFQSTQKWSEYLEKRHCYVLLSSHKMGGKLAIFKTIVRGQIRGLILPLKNLKRHKLTDHFCAVDVNQAPHHVLGTLEANGSRGGVEAGSLRHARDGRVAVLVVPERRLAQIQHFKRLGVHFRDLDVLLLQINLYEKYESQNGKALKQRKRWNNAGWRVLNPGPHIDYKCEHGRIPVSAR